MKATNSVPLIAASRVLVTVLCLLWLPVVRSQQIQGPQKMIWVPASNSSALCNDYTRAGFFIRRNATSKNWVLFLEGGGLCYNSQTCNRRFFASKVKSCMRTLRCILAIVFSWDACAYYLIIMSAKAVVIPYLLALDNCKYNRYTIIYTFIVAVYFNACASANVEIAW